MVRATAETVATAQSRQRLDFAAALGDGLRNFVRIWATIVRLIHRGIPDWERRGRADEENLDTGTGARAKGFPSW